jgi:hypothetical protein
MNRVKPLPSGKFLAHGYTVRLIAPRVVLDARGDEAAIDERARRNVVDRGFDRPDGRNGEGAAHCIPSGIMAMDCVTALALTQSTRKGRRKLHALNIGNALQ